jgi:hypothetical protein
MKVRTIKINFSDGEGKIRQSQRPGGYVDPQIPL